MPQIPNGIKYDQFTTAISQQDSALEGAETLQANRYCGRYFQTVGTAVWAAAEPSSICCKNFFIISHVKTIIVYKKSDFWILHFSYSIFLAYVTPFVLGVDFDNNEICETEAAGTSPNECEGIGNIYDK